MIPLTSNRRIQDECAKAKIPVLLFPLHVHCAGVGAGVGSGEATGGVSSGGGATVLPWLSNHRSMSSARSGNGRLPRSAIMSSRVMTSRARSSWATFSTSSRCEVRRSFVRLCASLYIPINVRARRNLAPTYIIIRCTRWSKSSPVFSLNGFCQCSLSSSRPP